MRDSCQRREDVLDLWAKELWGGAERIAILPEGPLVVINVDLFLSSLRKFAAFEKTPYYLSRLDLREGHFKVIINGCDIAGVHPPDQDVGGQRHV